MKKYIIVIFLLVVLVSRLWHLDYNSPFLDEAMYIRLGLDALHGDWSALADATSWVGGSPYIYPLFASMLYMFGGIQGARIGNVLWGIVATYCLYVWILKLKFFQEKVFNIIAGFVGAVLFACAAVPTYISRLAIYDMPSFSLFTISMVMLMYAVTTKKRLYTISAAIFLFMAFLTKYIVGIYIPFIILFVLWRVKNTKSNQNKLLFIREFIFVLVFCLVIYALFMATDLFAFLQSNAPSSGATVQNIIVSFFQPSQFLFVLGAFGTWFLFEKKIRRLITMLFAASLLPLIAHLIIKNDSAATQASLFSLFFLTPIISWCLVSLIKWHRITGVGVAIVLIIVNTLFAIPVIKEAETSWPNTNESIEILKNKIKSSDRVLAEAEDVYSIALYRHIPKDHINGPFEFDYKGLQGKEAYASAVTDGYFKFIELEDMYFSDEDFAAIEEKLPTHYALTWTDGTIRLYEHTAP